MLLLKPSTWFSGGKTEDGRVVSPSRSATVLSYCARVSNAAGATEGTCVSHITGSPLAPPPATGGGSGIEVGVAVTVGSGGATGSALSLAPSHPSSPTKQPYAISGVTRMER